MSTMYLLIFVVLSLCTVQGYLHVPGMQKLPTPVDHLLRGGPGKPHTDNNQKESSWDEFPETGMAWFWHDMGPNSAKKLTSSDKKYIKNMDVIPHGKVGRSYHWDYVPHKDPFTVSEDSVDYDVPKGKVHADWSDKPKENVNNDWSDMPRGKVSDGWSNMPSGKGNDEWSDMPRRKFNDDDWNAFSQEVGDWDDLPKGKVSNWSPMPNALPHEWNSIPQSRMVKHQNKYQSISKSPEEERIGPQQNRIVGGRDVQDGEVPWQVSLQRKSMRTGKIYHICGGSIINREWLITAAHCVALALMSNYRVVSGTSELKEENRIKGRTPTYTIHKVVDAHIHDSYDMFRFRNDIALLKVSPSFDIGGSVSAISLPSPHSEFGGQAVASGWGLMQEGVRVTPSRLQTVILPLWSDDKCRQVYGDNVADTMICAGYEQGGKSVCQGDSGGPLFQSDGGQAVLIGVVSWGVGCARPGKPGVYTEVSHYINWIRDVTGGN